jgi:hypothetical protein
MKPRLAAVVCATVFVALRVGLQATTLAPTDLGDLSRAAGVVARGRIVAIQAEWAEDHRGVDTLVTLQADAYLKGRLGPAVQFRVPGGRIGRFRSITVGAPEFAVGQYVVVFLGARGPAVPHLIGLGQGVFRLARSADGWLVTPPAVVAPANAGGPMRVVRGDPSRRPLSLADFERQVLALAAGSR